MDLSKYIGSVPEGTWPAKITDVTAEPSKDGTSHNLVFHANFPSLELTDKQWRRSLKNSVLHFLKNDLEAAEALREGESYSDAPDELAREIANDLSDRYVMVEVKPGKNGYTEFKIIGLELSTAA